MKTEKYSISFESVETALTTEIFISKKEYDKQIDFLAKQAYETAGNEFPLEQHTITRDGQQLLVIQHRFSVGTGDVYLTIYTCKPGYHFTK